MCLTLECTCGVPMSIEDIAPDTPEPLCPTCADLWRQAQDKRVEPPAGASVPAECQ